MPKGDDGVMDNLDSRVEGFSRKERKGRRDLNHGIHRIHENGRARWSHRNPLSFVVRRPSFTLPREERRWLAGPRRNCRGGGRRMRRTPQKWYNMQYINMSGNLSMGTAGNASRARYSAAYPTDAPEKLCFGGKPHEVRPMVWPDRRSLRGAKSLEA